MLFQLSEKVLLNQAIIISNREVFDYEHNESTNEKSIINLMMNKTEKKRKQAKRTSISLIMFNETDNF